jgi:hypothetical protein
MYGDNNANIDFPSGYEILKQAASGTPASASSLQSVASCSSFASQGTVLSGQQVQAGTIQVILFKTSTGQCVKFAPEFQGVASNNGTGQVVFVGYYAISNAAGVFAY